MESIQKTTNKQSIRTKDLVMTGMFTAVICVMSQITIPIQPIPFSLGLFAIFLTGTLLTPRYAFLSVLCYLLLGTFGLPVFAGFKGGLQNLVGMTGGYLAAYPIIALITSLCYSKARKYKTISLVLGMLVSLIVCYGIGTTWFSYVSGTGFYKSLTLCVFPFIPFDLVKIALAASVGAVIRKTVMKQI
ncbi:MAG TPA: biotin transporter BioY [Clostridiales bacterium]|nr:biotin transporter BioY [Clostridiales bacterium]